MIYPFDVQTGADPRIGQAIAQISRSGDGRCRRNLPCRRFRKASSARIFWRTRAPQQADFYISGYVTPVGESAAVVEQVVSVESGVILFSQTAQVPSVADVASQSLLARSQILAFVGRGTQNVATQPANTPAPISTNGAKMPISGISNIVNSVFNTKGAARAARRRPVVKPSRGVIVAPVTATGAARRGRSHQRDARTLSRTQRSLYNAQVTGDYAPAPRSRPIQICGAESR